MIFFFFKAEILSWLYSWETERIKNWNLLSICLFCLLPPQWFMLQKKVLSETHSMKTVPLRRHHFNSKLTFYHAFILHCHLLSFGWWCPTWLNFSFHCLNLLFFSFLWGLGRGIWFLSELKMEGVRETIWIQQSDENRVEDTALKM